MQIHAVINRLRANAAVFDALTRDVSEEQARWKPDARQWSVLEVVNHLADEEVEDFRSRLDLTLHRPGTPWPVIDPEHWAVERHYNRRNLRESVESFMSRRDRSARWLESLHQPEWTLSYEHPKAGGISAGDLLAAWLAHDYLHIRQLSRLHRQYVQERVAPFSVDYAGPW